MYKIFINNKPLFLSVPNVEQALCQSRNILCTDYRTKEELLETIRYFETDNSTSEAHVFHHDIHRLKEVVFGIHEISEAAGGVVFNATNEVLLIYRKGKWDLPKGKIEIGEKRQEAAVREVTEETGVQNLVVESYLQIYPYQSFTLHTYHLKSKRVLKPTYWYQMRVLDKPVLIPQAEEDIEQVIWVKQENLSQYLDKTYLSILDVIRCIMQSNEVNSNQQT